MADSFAYDAFISCSAADEEFVEWLRARLERAGLKTLTSYELRGGLPKYVNKEQAIRVSAHVVPILSPAWVEDEWKQLDTAIANAVDPAAKARKIIPLLLADCEIPTYLQPLETRDFRRVAGREQQARLLIADLLPPPAQPEKILPTLAAKISSWVWRHPALVALAILIVLLVVSAVLKTPSFQGWVATKATDGPLPPWRIHRVGDVLLLGTLMDRAGCDANTVGDSGLRDRRDGETEWTPRNPPLLVNLPDGKCGLASIFDFASSPANPNVVYAATGGAGLLKEDLPSLEWSAVTMDAQMDMYLATVAVDLAQPGTLYVSGKSKGLYRLQNDKWVRLDIPGTCSKDPNQNLPSDVRVYSILARDGQVYAGTGYGFTEDVPLIGGLYWSADEGKCWVRIHNAEARYDYRVLRFHPSKPNHIIALIYDHRAPITDANYYLWELGADLHTPIPFAFQTREAIDDLYISSDADPYWYLATVYGRVVGGPVNNPRVTTLLPFLDSCLLSCRFPPKLARDTQSKLPLVLANGQVNRIDSVGWTGALRQWSALPVLFH